MRGRSRGRGRGRSAAGVSQGVSPSAVQKARESRHFISQFLRHFLRDFLKCLSRFLIFYCCRFYLLHFLPHTAHCTHTIFFLFFLTHTTERTYGTHRTPVRTLLLHTPLPHIPFPPHIPPLPDVPSLILTSPSPVQSLLIQRWSHTPRRQILTPISPIARPLVAHIQPPIILTPSAQIARTPRNKFATRPAHPRDRSDSSFFLHRIISEVTEAIS